MAVAFLSFQDFQVRFLRLVTANDGDVRMIVTFQDGAEAPKYRIDLSLLAIAGGTSGSREALLAIASHALNAGSSAGRCFGMFLACFSCFFPWFGWFSNIWFGWFSNISG